MPRRIDAGVPLLGQDENRLTRNPFIAVNARKGVWPQYALLLVVVSAPIDSELPRLAALVRPKHEETLGPIAFKRLVNALTLQPALIERLQQLTLASKPGIGNDEQISARLGWWRSHFLEESSHALKIKGPDLIEDR